MGRPASCDCGECAKCKHRAYMHGWYQAKSPEERRAVVLARDPGKVRAADRARYYRDWEKRRAAMDAYASANKERVTAQKKAWDQRNPEKKAASIAVNNAVRDGRLMKEPCEECGSTNRIHGHHDDYSKPLDVRWLCPKHHAALRRKQ